MKRAGSERKVRRIQEVLDSRRMSFSDIARELGVKPPIVWRTAHGHGNHRRTLQRFLDIGVNPRYLDLPPDMLIEVQKSAVA